jgi:hypothetical protein
VNKETLEEASFTMDLFQLGMGISGKTVCGGIQSIVDAQSERVMIISPRITPRVEP